TIPAENRIAPGHVCVTALDGSQPPVCLDQGLLRVAVTCLEPGLFAFAIGSRALENAAAIVAAHEDQEFATPHARRGASSTAKPAYQETRWLRRRELSTTVLDEHCELAEPCPPPRPSPASGRGENCLQQGRFPSPACGRGVRGEGWFSAGRCDQQH